MADAKMFWQHCILHTCAAIIGEFIDTIIIRGDALFGVTFVGMSGFLKRGKQQRCDVSLFTLGATKVSQPGLAVC